MKVQLIAINYSTKIGFENLGVERICAYLKKKDIDCDSEYLYYSNSLEEEKSKIDLSCDLFGISVYDENLEFSCRLAKYIRKNKPVGVIFFGSKFITDAADVLIEDYGNIVDFFVLGHGEFPIYDFIYKFKEGESVQSIVENHDNLFSIDARESKKVSNIDINLLPWPERKFLKTHNTLHAYISDAHDCTGRCSFCSGTTKKWTGRTAVDIFNEVVAIYNETKIRSYFFTSGSFEDPGTRGKGKIKELCELFIEYDVKFAFGCYLRAESFTNNEKDIELLKLMKQAGVYQIFIGIEAGNQEDLLLYNKRANYRQNIEAIELMKNLKIYNNYGFIMLNPFSDLERLTDNFNLLCRDKCSMLSKYISRLCVYYNTPIYHILKEKRLLKKEYNYRNYYSYIIEDKCAKEINTFLETHFYAHSDLMKNYIHFADNLNFFYFSQVLMYNIDKNIIKDFENILENIADCIIGYFNILYVEFDIPKCVNLYNDFAQELTNLYNVFENKKNMKLLKLYMKMLREEKI